MISHGEATTLQEPVAFVGVALDQETRKADEKLYKYLGREANLEFHPQELEYGTAIRRVVEWREEDGPYLARMTPYAYVAAEMLGANFEILATYVSKATRSRTYHSYFLVNRNSFDSDMNRNGIHSEPTLDDLLSYIRQKKRRFIYHDKFSTSSYFLPSLYFRGQRIFATGQSDENLTAIHIEKVPGSSSSLVERVAEGSGADLAAVWDGTKTKFKAGNEFKKYGSKLYFIPLPTPLPNDLIVCSRWLDSATKENISKKIRSMRDEEQINLGDFMWWEDIREASDAREALATLRREAAEHPAQVTVDIKTSDPEYLKAAQQAVRLSGTEFVLYDSDFHKHVDVTWTLKLIHDEAILLTTDIKGSGLKPQEFQISFTDTEDLTKRIGAHIHSRMHRIRYIWPYEEAYPVVIRDVDFPIRLGLPLKVQRIAWLDPKRNLFREGDFFDAQVERSDFYQFRLAAAGFPKASGEDKLDFDPMSNISYRVILVRPSQERLVFRVLTYVFIGLFILAAVGAVMAVRRRPEQPPVLVSLDSKLFHHTCQALVEDYHRPWQDRRIADLDVLWCNRPRIEEYITELKTGGLKPKFDEVIRRETRHGLGIKVPFLKVVEGSSGKELIRELSVDPKAVGDTARLAHLIKFLVEERQLSPFIGKPKEWDALNIIAYQTFKAFDGDRPGYKGDGLLRQDDPMLLGLVSKHFNQVLEESFDKVSFFRQTWEIEKNESRYLLTHRENFSGALQIETREGTVSGLMLEFNLPGDAGLQDDLSTNKVDAWLLGKIARRPSCHPRDGIRYLCLHFRTIAVLRIYEVSPESGDSLGQSVSEKIRRFIQRSG
jgi:ABC-type phosphate/phosphonate transport system substrate-binding protein